jgi:5'-3' exonuclease
MILIDLSQIMVASTMMSMGKDQSQVDISMVRHMVLNSLRMYRQKYHNEYGELVLCCDGRHSWRREHFPQYKAARKTNRDADSRDWTQIFGCLDTIKSELREYFPYKYLEIDESEADDIIGVLARKAGTERVMIISGDKDFIQLQKYKTVKQYSPITKKLVTTDNPYNYLKEHILRGDSSDGIPNFLSSDNCIVDKIRQKPLSKKKVESWLGENPVDFCNEEQLRNYHRNMKLIDLQYTPSNIVDQIGKQYDEIPKGKRSGLLNYFIERKLNNLIQDIGEF